MRHICFAFIRKYKAIENIGFKIDSRFDYHFDPNTNVLTIEENSVLPQDFWGCGLYSVSAIIGNNGAGKSTVLSFLLESLVDGANTNTVNGILVYSNDGKLEVFGDNVLIESSLDTIHITKIPKLTCFYYSSHFMPYVSFNDLRACELSGGYNASDNWLLVKDVESYTGINALGLGNSLSWHLNQFVAQNNYRVCSMLADERLWKSFVGISLPRYVQFGMNQSGYYALLNHIQSIKRFKEQGLPVTQNEEELSIPKKEIIHPRNRDKYLEGLIYYGFLNLMNDGIGSTYKESKDALAEWDKYKNNTHPILDQFSAFVSSRYNTHTGLKALCSILSEMNSSCHFYDDGSNQSFYLEIAQNRKELASLVNNAMKNHLFLVGKVFDMYYSQDLSGTTILSSGEQQLLDLFSRLYDAIVLSPEKFANVESKRLILLDEAEIGFHPEWQRKYINLVTSFLERLYAINSSELFQVIISTHSPILLSDIPTCCITFLQRNEDGTTQNVSESIKGGSFAANVFEQYRESFFLENGIIGEFAEKKIRQVVDNLKNNKELKNAERVIRIIGDDRIKAYLWSLNPSLGVDEQIRFYKRQIETLEKGIKNKDFDEQN